MHLGHTGGLRRALIVAMSLLTWLVVFPWGPPRFPHASAQTSSPIGDFYGLNFVAPSEPWLTLAVQSGAQVVRWQFNWRDHEPSPGNWDWSYSDRAIEAWNQAGLKVHAILHNPPDFALAHPGAGLMPVNFSLPWDHPSNGWGRYCHEFAARYRGRIASYEVWNEPDLDIYWEGSAQEYFALMRTCYVAIKAADPNTPVAMAGMALLIEPDFFPEVVRLAHDDPEGARHSYYFDAANIHMYADPELVYSLTVQTRDVLKRYGMEGKPVWITETNIPLRGAGIAPNYPSWRYATQDEAGWFVLQAISNAYTAGASRIMFFRLADDNMEEAFGLVAGDGTPRPAYRALQLATDLMADITSAQREIRSGVVISTLRRADGARIVTMYSVAGRTVDLTVRAEQSAGVLINAVGGHSAIEPDARGYYTVSLLPARGRDFSKPEDYSVGGPPLIIVEYDRDGPTAQLVATQLPQNKAQVRLRWQGDDGPHGTGVATYDVEMSLDGGSWQMIAARTAEQNLTYDLPGGGVFTFRVRATDKAGNVGPYSSVATVRLFATLSAQVVDLRGQPVPYARVELSDGSLHDADAAGIVRIEFSQAGVVSIARVEGSAQGLGTPPPVEVALGQDTTALWTLIPQPNLIPNSTFERGLEGWSVSSAGDVQAVDLQTDRGSVLRLRGGRRAWGPPSASTAIVIPRDMSQAVLHFAYRLPVAERVLRLRAITRAGQQTLWHTQEPTLDFADVLIEVGALAGQRVELRFELWSTKDSGDGIAEIDDVILGNVPILSN